MNNTAAQEKALRIKVTLAAVAYEFYDISLMSDIEFDKLNKEIDTSITTDRSDLDKWFKIHHNKYTGMWVRMGHPEINFFCNIVKYVIRRPHIVNKAL